MKTMRRVSGHQSNQGNQAIKIFTRPIYGFALRRVMELAQKNLIAGSVVVTLPNGEVLSADSGQPGPQAHCTINDFHGIWMVLTGGDLGFAEAYMAGHLDTPEVKNILDLALANDAWFGALMNNRGLAGLLNAVKHRFFNDNTKDGSRKNIYAHYDLGNEFYEAWLDQSMTYSSALFDDVKAKEDLFDAQQSKYRRIAQIGQMTPQSNVLEIGCGWGGFAEFAAKNIGCKVTGVTISEAQYNYAAQRIQSAGLGEKVELRIQDYRDIEPNSFDRIASIEMFEAVGEKHWPHFFDQVKSILKPNGVASMQIITIADDLFDHYRDTVDFIQKYIFPGGMLPSMTKLLDISSPRGLNVIKNDGFGLHYARTLLEWNLQFQSQWNRLTNDSFDEPFRRMWEYYLKYCASGFEANRIDVRQIAWRRL